MFLYSFEYEVDPVIPDRVAHGFDVNFVFGNSFGPPLFASYALSAADLALSQAMSVYWMDFASTGNPDSDERAVVHWPAFKHPSGLGSGADKYLIFDSIIRKGQRFREVQCDFWSLYFFRSVTGAVPASTP